MTKIKTPSPKKMAEELRMAQGRVDSACVRGEPEAVINKLRAERDEVAARLRVRLG